MVRVAYDFVSAAWQGDRGGNDAETAYRRYVERGLTEPPENPVRDAAHGWLPGSLDFVEMIRARVGLAGNQAGGRPLTALVDMCIECGSSKETPR